METAITKRADTHINHIRNRYGKELLEIVHKIRSVRIFKLYLHTRERESINYNS